MPAFLSCFEVANCFSKNPEQNGYLSLEIETFLQKLQMLQYIVNQDVSNPDNFKRTDHGICMVSVELCFEQPVSLAF